MNTMRRSVKCGGKAKCHTCMVKPIDATESTQLRKHETRSVEYIRSKHDNMTIQIGTTLLVGLRFYS